MDSLQYQFGRRFRHGCVSIDPSRFLGPKYPLRTDFRPDAADVAQSLGFCQTMFVTPQGFFDALTVFDVSDDAVPFDDVSILSSQWKTAIQMPSIFPIRSAKTNFAFMRFATCNGCAPLGFVPLKIIGMNCILPRRPGCLCRRHARVLHESAVHVSIRAVMQCNPHYCRNRIDDVSKLLLGPLPFFNIEIDPDPIQQSSVRVPDRFGATEEPAVPHISVTHAKTHLTSAACA